ncbi:MAG: lysozyme inhibitor LprI family protein [Pseudomonadota bacterium]
MVLFLAILSLGTTAAAAEEPNCSNPSTQPEMTACASLLYEEADAELNRVYKLAIENAKRMDADFQAGPIPLADLVRDAQRAWIPFRDRACEVEAGLAQGGTASSQFYLECLDKLTRRRIDDLTEVTRY